MLPELCGNEEFFSWNATLTDRSTDSFFISIDSRCIDQAVSVTDRGQDALLTHLRVRHLKHAKAKYRHLYSIVDRSVFHHDSLFSGFCSYMSHFNWMPIVSEVWICYYGAKFKLCAGGLPCIITSWTPLLKPQTLVPLAKPGKPCIYPLPR